jgi:hypothetical protein
MLILKNDKNKIFFHDRAIILPNGPSFKSFPSYDPKQKTTTVCFEVLGTSPYE